jgi:hypothetical protein
MTEQKIFFYCCFELDPRCKHKLELLGADPQEARSLRTFASMRIILTRIRAFWSSRRNSPVSYVFGCPDSFPSLIMFVLLHLFGGRRTVIEVGDLPLRDRTLDSLRLAVMRIICSIASGVVFTSDSFAGFVPVKKYFIFHNFPCRAVRARLYALRESREDTDRAGQDIRCIFYGRLRYLDIVCASYRDRIIAPNRGKSLELWGGPKERIYRASTAANRALLLENYNGKYVYDRDITRILSNVDIILATYDISQMNARLAIPNKLFDAVCSAIPIVVSGDTELSRLALEYRIDYSVFQLEEFPSTEKLENTFVQVENDFLQFIASF